MSKFARNNEKKNRTVERSFVCIDQTITISLPCFFLSLLKETLSGWSIEPNLERNEPDIVVSFNDGLFSIETPLRYAAPKRVDMIDALNQFFLCLAYFISAKIKMTKLIHCGSFCDSGSYTIILGAKNSGKSTLLLQKSQQGNLVLADDLLLWFPMLGKFTCLGLPLRLRVAGFGSNGEALNLRRFVIGERIAYSRNHAVEIAQAGHTFTPDHVCQYVNQEMLPVNFVRWPKLLFEHRISRKNTDLTVDVS